MTIEFTDHWCELVRSLSKRAADLEVFLSMTVRDNSVELAQAVHLGRRVRAIETDAAALAHVIEENVTDCL